RLLARAGVRRVAYPCCRPPALLVAQLLQSSVRPRLPDGPRRELGANIPILLSSGYDSDETPAELACLGFSGFLKKPYDFGKMREMFKVLGQDRRGGYLREV
ncbi:MAG: hypothetical protein OXU20_06885, partial [Myxococcales bacterium]|nr:hypothetical protein [Myxococcales bacterium]